ncbi:unnamed protein product [Calicophoron daubneyi]|uniref:Uncharacterized protein n=1 Tax=Calicophoron daubneyi TaxID=300641 RepID=A0AAV2TJI4_CALDB
MLLNGIMLRFTQKQDTTDYKHINRLCEDRLVRRFQYNELKFEHTIHKSPRYRGHESLLIYPRSPTERISGSDVFRFPSFAFCPPVLCLHSYTGDARHRSQHTTISLEFIFTLILLFVNSLLIADASPIMHPTGSSHLPFSLDPVNLSARKNSSGFQISENISFPIRILTVRSVIFDNEPTNRSDTFYETSVSKLYMRSHRTRRSLDYYMISTQGSPMVIVSTVSEYHPWYLSVTDTGIVKLRTASVDETTLFTIAVIIERSKFAKGSNVPISPYDNAQVILRRFRTNICVCMTTSGVVVTERLVNNTITDNCGWRLRISRYGVGFEHLVQEDDRVGRSDSMDHMVLTEYSKTSKPRVATLSVQRAVTNTIASGWLHKLWQPQATWIVHDTGFNDTGSGHILNTSLSGTLNHFSHFKADNRRLTTQFRNSSNKKHQRTPMTMGRREYFSQYAPPHSIGRLCEIEQHKYCHALFRNLTSVIEREIRAAFATLEKIRTAHRHLKEILAKNPPDTIFTDEVGSYFRTDSLANVLDKWMYLTNIKWQKKIHKRLPRDNPLVTRPHGCLLTLSTHFTRPFMHADKSLENLLERTVSTKIYHDLFLRVQHIAKWSPQEKNEWLHHPRLPKLFRFLGLHIPSAAQLRQSAFVLHRYLSYPENLVQNFSVNGQMTFEMLVGLWNKNKTYREASIKRASLLKFEELRFWPRVVGQSAKRALENTPITCGELLEEIKQLKIYSNCYKTFMSQWRLERRYESPSSCENRQPHPQAMSLYRKHQ